MAFYKTALVFLISLFCGGIENMCSGMDFRSDELAEMSRHIAADYSYTDTTFTVRHDAHDVTVRISDGCVEHIGFRIFPEQFRSGTVNPLIADFVERYWLSLTLPLKRQKPVSKQMSEDRFVFRTGNVETVGILQQDATIPVSCQVLENLIILTWGDAANPVCRIEFPVDHELILGRRMLENDRRLPQEINRVRIAEQPPVKTGNTLPQPTDTLSMRWVDNAGSYLDCSLKSRRYYTCSPDGMVLEPVFDNDRCVESIVNLFTGYDIEKGADIRLSIRHKTFGLNEQTIETTIRKFVAYCMQNGCIPFVGVVSIDNEISGSADILVIMHNRQIGYNHVLRASVPLDCISTGSGTSHARLNAFVPSSNIKNLFKN